MSAYTTAASDSVGISLAESLCKDCGICVARCPADVFETTPDRAVPSMPRVDDCVDCGTCELLCPDFALEVTATDGQ